jgi:hypothetical protein
VAFTKVLTMYQYITLEFTPSTALLYPPPPIPGIVSMGIIFAFIYMGTHLSQAPPPSHLYQFPLLQFCRRIKKEMTFLLV